MAVIPCVATTTRTMGEICDAVDGIIRTGPFGSQLHESDYTASGTPVVMPKNIVSGRVSTDDIARIGVTDSDRLAQHKLQFGDIVYGRRGDIGRRALITDREAGWLCGTGCLRISLGDTVIDPQFLYYYLGLPNVVRWIANKAVGATLPNLNTEILRSVEVIYPPLPTQRKIAGILSAYDDLIANNTRRIAILEEMARALYREWFVEFRFPGHENVRMVESELGAIPEGWRVARLGDVINLSRGRSYSSSNLAEVGGLPFLNLKCIERDGGFRYDGIKRYVGPYRESQLSHPGDIIMAVTDMTQERRIVARAARVPATREPTSVISMDLVKIIPALDTPAEYVYGVLRWSSFADEVKQHANGANVLHLNPQRIVDFRFPFPASILACKYASIVSSIFVHMNVLQQQNLNLRQMRDLLLPKLVSGEVDVEGLEIAEWHAVGENTE